MRRLRVRLAAHFAQELTRTRRCLMNATTAQCGCCRFLDSFGCFDNRVALALLEMLLFVVVDMGIRLRAHEQAHLAEEFHLTIGRLKAGEEVVVFMAERHEKQRKSKRERLG